MVKTRHSGGRVESEEDNNEILDLTGSDRVGRTSRKVTSYAEIDDDDGDREHVDEDFQPRKKYNMRNTNSVYKRPRYAMNDSDADDEIILNNDRNRSKISGRSTRNLERQRCSNDYEHMNTESGHPRRSTRQRRMVYDTFNLSSIDKYPVAGSQFEDDMRMSTRRKRNSPSPTGKYVRELSVLRAEAEEPIEIKSSQEDMYSRIKRDRRLIGRDIYGIPLNEADQNGHVSEDNGSTTEVEASGEEKKNVNEVEESEGESTSEEEGPKQYYLREHRPRTQIFEAAPVVSNRRPPNKLMNIIPNSPARRRDYLSHSELNSSAHKSRSFRSRRRTAFHGSSSSTSTSSSASSSDEAHFEKRKHRSMQKSRNRCLPMNMQPEDLTGVLKDRAKIGSSLADVDPMNIDKSVTFESVGGLGGNIRALKEMIIFPLMYPEVFDKFHIQPPRGVLFYGPPGTGKTLVARALANECSKGDKRVAFFMRKGADCLSKWVGESERQLRLLFDQAYQMRPSILFFDEIDGLAPVRSSKQDQIHSSIVSTLLALMDGLDSRGEVVIIGATNRIDSIDPALRRPGRFDREFLFPLPSFPARKQILSIHTSKWSPPLPDSFIDELTESTAGYCGADLRSLCTEAALYALRRRYPQIYTTSHKLQLNVNSIRIGAQDFHRAVNTIVPASQRAVTSPGRAIQQQLLPLLKRQLDQALTQLRKIFPVPGLSPDSPVMDDVVLSDYDDEDALTGSDGNEVNPPGKYMASFSSSSHQTSAYRPRLLLCGREGQGQSSYLAPAIIHHLERLPVHVVDLPALYGVSTRTPEESCAQIFREARRTSPSIIYMPYMDQWWQAVTETLMATFLTLLQDVAPTQPILLLATCDSPHLKSLPAMLQSVFWSGSRITMENPNCTERKSFFEDLFMNHACKAPRRKRTDDLEELEVLDKAASPEPRKLTEKEEKRLFEHEDATLRELRLFLRDVINKLAQDRKFAIFSKPVDIEEVDDYYDVIKSPMDLSTMMSKIDLHQYQTGSSFLFDIDLICSNALEYNPDKNPHDRALRHRACALRDIAHSILDNELDPDFDKRCEEIDAAREQRGQSPTKTAPKYYKLPPKSRTTRSNPSTAENISAPSTSKTNSGSQSDPEISLKSTPLPRTERKVTSRSMNKVKVISRSVFGEMQRKRSKLSPWCRPKRRKYRRLLVVDDPQSDQTDDVTTANDVTVDDVMNDESKATLVLSLTPIKEKMDEGSESPSPRKLSPEKRKSRDHSPAKSRDHSPTKSRDHSPTKSRDLSPTKDAKNLDKIKREKLSPERARKPSPEKRSPSKRDIHCSTTTKTIIVDKSSDRELGDDAVMAMDISELNGEVKISPRKPPHSPARSPRSGSPRTLALNSLVNEETEVRDDSDTSGSMPKLSAPSPIIINNEDSNKENDLPHVVPKLTTNDNDVRKRKRTSSGASSDVDVLEEAVDTAGDAGDTGDTGDGGDAGTEGDDEAADDDDTTINATVTKKLSPRVTPHLPTRPPPPPLVVDKAAMTSLWESTVERTRGYDVERLENLHCNLRERVHAYRHDYDKTQLLRDLRTVVDSFILSQLMLPSTS